VAVRCQRVNGIRVHDSNWQNVFTAVLTCKWPGIIPPLTNVYFVESIVIVSGVVDDYEMGIKHWLVLGCASVLHLLPVSHFICAPTASESCGHYCSVTPLALCHVVWHRSTWMRSNPDLFGSFEYCNISSAFIYCCGSLYSEVSFVRVRVLTAVCWGFKSCRLWHMSLDEWSLTFWRIVVPLKC
jgi:hypothetical protein